MCGIVGYVSRNIGVRAKEFCLHGLTALEYRGYDAAGIALIAYGETKDVVPKMMIFRKASKRGSSKSEDKAITILKTVLSLPEIVSQSAIAHTRWATHGEPSEKNTHPHTDCSGDIVVCHNGQISNCQVLRENLEARGHRFSSDTDTEVIAHLIEEQLTSYDCESLELAVRRSLTLLRGSFGLVIMDRKQPELLIVACQKAQISIANGEGEMFIASDPRAFRGYANNYISLEYGEMAAITPATVQITSFIDDCIVQEKARKALEGMDEGNDKGEYAHIMLKEIFEEPEAVERAIAGRIQHEYGSAVLGGATLEKLPQLIDKEHIYMLGCGTAYYAGMAGAMLLREVAGYRVTAMLAESFLTEHYPLDPKKDFVIVVTQSGNTRDTIEAMEEAQRQGVLVFGIVNREDSHIGKNDDAGIFIYSGDEIAVASTKVYVGQIAALAILALYLARPRGKMTPQEGRAFGAGLASTSKLVKEVLGLREHIAVVTQKIIELMVKNGRESMLVLGRGTDYVSAQEVALKVKEITRIHAEAYQSAEMKHGPIGLIREGYPVVVIANRSENIEKTYNTLEEVRARGAVTVVFGDCNDKKLQELANHFIPLPQGLEYFSSIVTAPALHLFAYELAVAKQRITGEVLNIDQPANLAKCVTV